MKFDINVICVVCQLKLKSVETEQFPAKTVLKWSPKVLEYRRQVFEKYLQVCALSVHLYTNAASDDTRQLSPEIVT